MISREEFAEDVKIGDVIQISTNQGYVAGKVERIGETTIKITRLDSERPKIISYSDITGYDFDIQTWEESFDLTQFKDSESKIYGCLTPHYGILPFANLRNNKACICSSFEKKGVKYQGNKIEFNPSYFSLNVDTFTCCYLVRFVFDDGTIDKNYPIEILKEINKKYIEKLVINGNMLNIIKTTPAYILQPYNQPQEISGPQNVPPIIEGEHFFYLKDNGIYGVDCCDQIDGEILYAKSGATINIEQQEIHRFATLSDFDNSFKYGYLNNMLQVPLSLLDIKTYNILKTARQNMLVSYSCSNNKVLRIEVVPSNIFNQVFWQKGKVTDIKIDSKERSFVIDETVTHLLSVLSDGIINKKVRDFDFKGTDIYYRKVACPNWNNNAISDFAIEVRSTSESAKIEYDSVRGKYIAYRNNTFFYEINGDQEELERLRGETTTVYFEIASDSHFLQASISKKWFFSPSTFGNIFHILSPFTSMLTDSEKKDVQSKIRQNVNELKDDRFAFDKYSYNCLYALKDQSQTDEDKYANLYFLFLSDFCNVSEFKKEFKEGRGDKNKILGLFNKTPQNPEQLLRHIVALEESSYKLLSQLVDFNSCQGLESILPFAKKMDTTAILGNDIEKCFEILRGIYISDKVKFFDRFRDIEENIIGETLSAIEDTEIRFVNFCCESDKSIFADIQGILKKLENYNESNYLEKEKFYKKSWNYITSLWRKKNDITIEFKDLLLSTNILSKLKQKLSQLLDELYKNPKFWPQIE